MNHKIKTDTRYFDAVALNHKTFELRKNDRNYQVGDTVELCETAYTAIEMSCGKPVEYTGREIKILITYVLRPQICLALDDGLCIFSFRKFS